MRSFIRPLFVAIAMGMLFTMLAFAQEAPKPAELPKPDTDGFVSLFNGKDLAGWEGLVETHWSVKDGAITGSQTRENSKHTFLILADSKAHPEKYKNFELRVKYKWDSATGDSGIQIRSKIVPDPREPNPFKVGGYQINTVPRRMYDGGFYDEANVAGQRGIMANRGFKTTWDKDNQRKNEPLAESTQDLLGFIKEPGGDFNDLVFTANGNKFTITLNGHLMSELVDESPKAVLEGGVVALQLHTGQAMTIQFKDIKIKFLEEKKP
jgi:hypothetical protein